MKFDKVYHKWNEKRIKAMIDHYSEEFLGQLRMVEVGCGYGEIGYAMQQLGADVTFVDARQDHLDYIKERDPNSKVILMDIDKDWPEGPWDMVIHFGVLYHLEQPQENLRRACASTKYMVLESEVIDSNDPGATKRRGEPDHYTQSMRGFGVRMSPSGIEKILKESSMKFEMLLTDKCDVSIHKYAWKAKNNKSCSPGQRRFWFVEKKNA